MKRLTAVIFLSFFLVAFPGSAFAQVATLSLEPSTGTFNRGCNFSLNVNLDTGGAQTDGADAIIIFDPSRLTATSITNGTIYPDFPGNNIDAAGKITISGLASVNTPFSGKGTLATINFTVGTNAPTGATQVKFDFDPANKAKTTDSNVVERATVVDILNSITDGNYTIGTGNCDGSVVKATVPPAPRGAVSTPSSEFKQPPPEQNLPPAGSEQLTFTIAIVGGVLTVLGVLGLALL